MIEEMHRWDFSTANGVGERAKGDETAAAASQAGGLNLHRTATTTGNEH